MNLLCKPKNLKTLVASLVLQQIKEAAAVPTQEEVKPAQSIECTCKIQ